MKVLAINGSSRKDGNTAQTLSILCLRNCVRQGLKRKWCSSPVQSLNPARLVGLAAGEKTVCIKRICFRKFLKR